MDNFDKEEFKVVVDRVYGMSEVQEAHKYMESNENIGKILLKYDL